MSWLPCGSQMALVLLASYSGVLGGAERVLVESGDSLDGEICLACPEGELADAGSARGFRVFALRARPLDVRAPVTDRVLAVQRLAAHGAELRRLARALDPDVVIACGSRSALGLLLGRRIGVPVVFEQGDMLPGPWIGRCNQSRRAARRACDRPLSRGRGGHRRGGPAGCRPPGRGCGAVRRCRATRAPRGGVGPRCAR